MIERYREDHRRLRQLIAERLQHGALPDDEPAQVIAGESDGRFCAACCCYVRDGKPEVRAIAANGGSTFFHPSCFALTAQVRADLNGAGHSHAAALHLMRALVSQREQQRSAAAARH